MLKGGMGRKGPRREKLERRRTGGKHRGGQHGNLGSSLTRVMEEKGGREEKDTEGVGQWRPKSELKEGGGRSIT